MHAPFSPHGKTLSRWQAVGIIALFSLIIGTFHVVLFPETFHDADEAAYLYMGEGWLNGELPYRDAYQTKPPGIYAIYATGLLFFPHSMTGVRILSFIAMGASLFLAYLWINKKALFPRGEKLFLFIGFLLFIHTGIEAEAALTELFALPFLIFLVTRGVRSRSEMEKETMHQHLLLGLAGGASLLLTIYSIPLIAYMIIYRAIHRSPLGLMLGGIVIAPLIFGIYFILNGAGEGMIFSLLTWPGRYQQTYFLSQDGFENAVRFFINNAVFLVGLGGGLLLMLVQKKEVASILGWWTALVIGSMVLVGSFFPHHGFLLWLPLAVGCTYCILGSGTNPN